MFELGSETDFRESIGEDVVKLFENTNVCLSLWSRSQEALLHVFFTYQIKQGDDFLMFYCMQHYLQTSGVCVCRG